MVVSFPIVIAQSQRLILICDVKTMLCTYLKLCLPVRVFISNINISKEWEPDSGQKKYFIQAIDWLTEYFCQQITFNDVLIEKINICTY